MKKLKTILEYNITYCILCICLIIYIIIILSIGKTYNGDINNFEGTITTLKIDKSKITFILKNKYNIRCNYYIDDPEYYRYYLGKKVRVQGNIKEINNNTVPNTFNYKKYLYNHNILLNINVSSIKVIKDENTFYKIKNSISKRIDKYQNKSVEYLKIFLLNDSSDLNEEIYSKYLNTGVWYLFSVSGMHINLVLVVLNKLLNKSKYKNYIIYSCITFLAFLTGFKPSIMRATAFYIIKSLFNEISALKALYLTLFISLFYNPYYIFDTGFQYSFIITYFIIKYSRYVSGNYFKKIFIISVISFLVSLPITANINYEINIVSPLYSIIFVPVISFIIFPLSAIVLFIPGLEFLYLFMINIIEKITHINSIISFNIIIPKPSIFIIIIYYLLLILFLNKKSIKFLMLLIILLFINRIIPYMDSNMYVHYFDVGQGDSEVIIGPYKKDIIMIDTGGLINSDYHVSDNIIKYFKSIGIKSIYALILTHGDADHMMDSIYLVENFNIENVIFNCGEYNDLEKDLIKALAKKKIKNYSCIKELNIDKYKLQFLNTKEYDNENDNSNVIYFNYNNYKFLFMGDAGVEKEKDILEKYNLIDIDFLKVGHHGSNTSSSEYFIDKINPKFSLISVGKNNRYGHPKDEVLDTLSNSKIYRTDLDGSIEIKLNKNGYKIRTCPP